MTSFQRILFPVDFSEECIRTAPFVKAFADRFQSEVVLLHVLELPVTMFGLPDNSTWPIAIDIDGARADRQSQLVSFLPEGFEGLKLRREMVDGDPALQIVSYAEERAVDLIMMPTHGYGPFRRLLLGSVTAKVLHDAHCAVWTSAHTLELTTHPPERCRRILCAVDTVAAGVEVLRWAAKFGTEQGAEVQLVHVIQAGRPDQFDSAAFDNFIAPIAQGTLAKMQAEAGTAFKVQVRVGNPGEAIHRVAVEQHADLVVIGRGVLQKALGRLRSNGVLDHPGIAMSCDQHLVCNQTPRSRQKRLGLRRRVLAAPMRPARRAEFYWSNGSRINAIR
ncbi:MAG: universal stress protein [Nitrospirota bacterium]